MVQVPVKITDKSFHRLLMSVVTKATVRVNTLIRGFETVEGRGILN